MKKRRTLSDEEKSLWEKVTRKDEKLSPSLRDGAAGAAIQPTPVVIKETAGSPRHFMARDDGTPLKHGNYAGIDRNTADRFRKGKTPIDGTIDLHGMTREKAHGALSRFLHSHYERGSRCLLAITGKGNSSFSFPSQGEDQGGSYFKKSGQRSYSTLDPLPNPPPNKGREQERRGVLREMLPQWLDEPELRGLVLAFDTAKQEHGGSGAYYILLRRKR